MITPAHNAGNVLLLTKQLKELQGSEYFSVGLTDDRLDEWKVAIFGPPGSLYEGGIFNARLSFPSDFPIAPPKMKFVTSMYHPNIFSDGNVCISILHPPGDDEYGFELASERWLPTRSIESIIISVIVLLSQDIPNTDSPANVDAAKDARENPELYKKKVRRLVRRVMEEEIGE